ncbi:MAG: hypothetical protein QME81_16210 [bacterium]|nr:hypothetical protein [bacterium]
MGQESEKRLYPKNPIGIIALFVFFIEVISTVSLKFFLDAQSPYVGPILVFIIAFPSIIALLFFLTLWFRRESLYSPSDFRDDASFVSLISKVETLEVKQEAAQLDPRGDPNAALSVINRLVEKSEFETAIHLGKAFLKVQRYESSRELFEYLRKVIPESNEYHRKAMEYYSYTLVGLKKYHVAIQEIEQLREGVHRPLGFWPSLALAYSYLKIDNHDRYEQWIRHAKIQKGSSDSLALVKGIYPELEEQFASGESTKYE